MERRRHGDSQAVASAKAGFSERTGRRLEAGTVRPAQRAPRHWRTRSDPLAEVWDELILPMLRQVPHLRATSVIEQINLQQPGRLDERHRRTLQRRIAHWRATEGPEREVIFRQDHPPGFQSLCDFTEGASLKVMINGRPFEHLLFHFWLAFSGWQYVKVIEGGESFTALTEGMQEALWQLGAVPQTNRTDRLSAAYRNLAPHDDASAGYQAFCDHYGIEPTRNNAGVSHENGSVEAAHGHLRRALREALALRGSLAFTDVAAYQAFVDEHVGRRNARRRAELTLELAQMKPLPRFKTTDFSLVTVTVTATSTISVRDVLYTVPSRLIGSRLRVHVYDARLVCYLGTTQVLTLKRHRRRGRERLQVVDYRHIIGALVKKPSAFRRSVLREGMFPRQVFRRAWEALDEALEPRRACRTYVALLHLAATHACEATLATHLEQVLAEGKLPDLETARAAVAPPPSKIPHIAISPPDLASYDTLFQQKEASDV
ncbi:IS21 family transposase [Labrys neptuniae]|uniref:IS21 family transposase n=1 Tax=Labrys neptuniae TaxID=376174 RepID=UPI00288D0232|nr:IS21 family transposase [Labrys neptuniae]MDT3382312.1 IS21 family transposase [Labrys neptuniae]